MTLKLPDISGFMGKKTQEKKGTRTDTGMGIAFVGAIAVLLLVAGYVISRLSGARAYQEKWKDYNDCGWA